MRTMTIKPFAELIEIRNIDFIIATRMRSRTVHWPDQAISLLSFMAWPNDERSRERWIEAHQSRGSADIAKLLRPIIQQHWARTADIFHLVYDLHQGDHQAHRGGASIGKAITIISENAKSKGTRPAKLWEIWKTYKDVAHLVTAAVLVSGEAQTRHRLKLYGLGLAQLQPYQVTMLLPDLVLAVAVSLEKFGLEYTPSGGTEPTLAPALVWRIPSDINLKPLDPPVRRLTESDIAMLNARRVGNRGQDNSKTTPVFG